MTNPHHRLKEARAKKERECVDCKQVKPWIFLKYSGMKKIYIDDKKSYWNSAVCPDCFKPKLKKYALRAKRRRNLAEG